MADLVLGLVINRVYLILGVSKYTIAKIAKVHFFLVFGHVGLV
jgi:hypothetical protein